ncbi:MAG: methyltransferase domain-containing protein [candidate division Zixibacteria bacterium]|nr:methyltransferase domain-containing protein [candidate division Zixibacteria bacterium]
MKDHVEHYKRDGDYFDYQDYITPGRREVERRRNQVIISVVKNVKAAGKILDVGSGSGELAMGLTDTVNSVFPVDLSLKNLKFFSHDHGISPVMADGYKLPFKNESFDAVILSSILEHCEEPSDMLREMNRLLKQGGALIAVTPYNEKIIYHQCIHCNKKTPAYAHLHSFREANLGSLIRENGFEINRILKFANKGMDITRINLMLKSLSLNLWRVFDRFANLLLNRPEFILMVGRKL